MIRVLKIISSFFEIGCFQGPILKDNILALSLKYNNSSEYLIFSTIMAALNSVIL